MLKKSSRSFRSTGVYLSVFYYLFWFDNFSIHCWLCKPNETLVIICWLYFLYTLWVSFSSCLQTHTIFLTRYLPTISIFRNRFIHGYAKNLFSDGYEYKLSNVELPLTSASPDLSVSEFTKNIIENLKRLIPEFFTAITTKINASTDLPA